MSKTPHTPHDLQDKTANTAAREQYDAPVQLPAGKVIMDKFTVIGHLGTGGMGSVFKVKHIHLQTFYALKCLNHKQGNDAIWRRFENEARAANRLDHPNLIKVHDSGLLHDGQPYFVMDLVEGTTLSQELEGKGTLNLAQALKIFIQVGFALSYAHENGVIHRDIKPSNIMLVKGSSNSLGGTVKVVDFGIAKLTGQDEFNQQTLTRTGEIFGSPLYMSPEQCMGIAVDHRSDLYSLGCVMYEALTGAPPMVGDSALTTMMKHQSEKPMSLTQASMGLEFPESIELIVAKLLEKNPDDRYQKASLLTADLVALEQGSVSKDNPTISLSPTSVERLKSRDAKKENNLFLAVIWSILMILLGFIVGVLFAKNQPESSLDNKAAAEPNQEKNAAATGKDKEYWASEAGSGRLPDFEKSASTASSQTLSKEYFSTLKDGGQTRVFHFPTEIAMGTLYREDIQQVVSASGTQTIKNFKPMVFRANHHMSQFPEIFAKFRPNELSGLIIDQFQENITPVLKNASNQSNLKLLSMTSSELKPTDVHLINQFKFLDVLQVKGTSISGEDLIKIERLPQIRNFSCGSVANIKPALEKFKGSKLLYTLECSTTKLGVEELKLIAQMPILLTLDVTNNKGVNDDTLPLLLPLTNLRGLYAERCPITVKSIPTLKKMKNLQELSISSDNLSAEDEATFRRELSIRKFKTEHSSQAIKDVLLGPEK